MQARQPIPISPPPVRVVVVEYSGEDVLRRCLASLGKTIPTTVPITIIDNASLVPAETLIPDEMRDRPGPIEVVRLGKNVGYAGAIERAWSIGDEEFLAIANNDLEFSPGWLDALIETARKTGASAVSSTIRHENESKLEKSTNASLNPLLHLVPGVFMDRTKAVYPSGACFLLRRDPGMATPPVEANYFLYYEDVYLGFLLRALGKTVVQCPDSEVRHVGSHAVGKSNPNLVAFLQERNRLVTQLLFFDLGTLLGISPAVFLDSLFKIPACWIRRKPVWATVRAHFWVLLNAGWIMRKRRALRRLHDFQPQRILPYLTGRILPPSTPGAGFWNSISTGWFRLVGIPVDREASR